MNKLMKLTAIVLLVFMLPVFSAFANDIPAAPTPTDHLNTIVSYYDANTTLTSWWDVVALFGAGADLTNYTLPEWTTESLGETATVTDYAGIILGLIASGENVHDIWNRDIADELAKMQDTQTGLFGTYPNQQIYSMLALDAANEPYDRDAALTALIDTFGTDDGAFGYLPFDPSSDAGVTADIDITAMALLLLNESDHSDIISSSIAYLASSQLENGGYASWGTENSNSLEAVISAFATHNLLENERFIKNGRSLSDVLSDYILDSGMLAWEAGDTDENLLATQQGLISYGDIIAGESVFLRLSSTEVCRTINAKVRIEGSAVNILNVPVTVKGYDLNVLDAVIAALDTNNIPYVLTGGNYLQSINSETAGKFGGWDGWLIALNGAAISTSADAVSLTEGDEVLVYYGMFEPQTLIPEYTLSATEFTQNTAFTITVTATYYDYSTSQNVTLPVSGVTVQAGASKFTTNENGFATVIPSESGSLTVKIYKEAEGSYPSIVRIVPFTIEVAAAPVSTRPHTGGSYVPVVKEDTEKETETDQEEAPSNAKEEPNKAPETKLSYNDSSKISDWALEGVNKAVAAGLFRGDDAGNFNPESSLSRAELATILLRLTGSSETNFEPCFEDISPHDWFYKAVCTVYELGFMNGTGETIFAPDDPVTREQVAVVLARILNLTSTKDSIYTDFADISDWAADSVNALTESGIVEGSDGKFNPGDILTREMCAVIMARALDFVNK